VRIVGENERASRAVELKQLLDAVRSGLTLLVVRDAEDHQRLVVLEDTDRRLTIGRSDACDIALSWDTKISRVHAELERLADGWVIVDDGLSQNGTFVEGERLAGRRRLHDGDTVRCGLTPLVFRATAERSARTSHIAVLPMRVDLTPMQHKVLVALCRPYRDGASFAVPATNADIAAELVLSIDAIKTHLRALYEKFGVDDLPQNEKRVRLAQLALLIGVVSTREL
jgi:hypothetical protein